MTKGTSAVLVLVLASLTACGERDDPKLEAAVSAINLSAEKCLLSVRDRRTKYEATASCNALASLSMAYLEAGGDKKGAPAKYDLRYISAQRMAWNALALSESCSGRSLRIW